MKKKFLLSAMIAAGLGMTACSVDTSGLEEAANDLEGQLDEASNKMDEEIEKAAEFEPTSSVMYQCPDDCENGPAYFKAGPCMSCGKEMVEI